jgi:hypothetical protein
MFPNFELVKCLRFIRHRRLQKVANFLVVDLHVAEREERVCEVMEGEKK